MDVFVHLYVFFFIGEQRLIKWLGLTSIIFFTLCELFVHHRGQFISSYYICIINKIDSGTLRVRVYNYHYGNIGPAEQYAALSLC